MEFAKFKEQQLQTPLLLELLLWSLNTWLKKAIITVGIAKMLWFVGNIEKQASLIKAMLVHSGQPTLGYCEQDLSCYTYGSNHLYYEGHGRIQLDRVLHYAGESDFELFLYNGQVNYEKEYFSLEFTITDISFKK